MKKSKEKNLVVGIISDGKYGERAFQNVKKHFQAKWILVPDLPVSMMLDEEIEIDIPECDLYISYVRHPDIILELAELQKPMILGVLPGPGLLKQTKNINNKVVAAPSMCCLESNTKVPEIDLFTTFYGRPVFNLDLGVDGELKSIEIKRSSICGSSDVGINFLVNKKLNVDNLRDFALNICHECRAPRFGHTCDKEIAGINHLVSLIDALPLETLNNLDKNLQSFLNEIQTEFNTRISEAKKLIDV